MSFSQKLITVQFNLANGQFEGGGNTATITGARISFHCVYPGGSDQGQAELAIYGLPLQLMNQLSTVGTQINKMYKNSITVEAGDTESGMSQVFGGVIGSAFVDAQSMPQVCFRVQASPGHFVAVQPVKPVSIKGSADVAGMMSNLAKQMGFAFENAGVSVKLANPYFGGTAWTQMLAIAEHANIDVTIDRGTMAIVSPSHTRQGNNVLISPQTGLVGYPAFNQATVLVKCIFNPDAKHYGVVEVKSSLTSANGKWKINRLEYDLESMVPHGKWFMILELVTTQPTIS